MSEDMKNLTEEEINFIKPFCGLLLNEEERATNTELKVFCAERTCCYKQPTAERRLEMQQICKKHYLDTQSYQKVAKS